MWLCSCFSGKRLYSTVEGATDELNGFPEQRAEIQSIHYLNCSSSWYWVLFFVLFQSSLLNVLIMRKYLWCSLIINSKNYNFSPQYPQQILNSSNHPESCKQQFALWVLPSNLYLFLKLPHYFKIICRNLMYFRLLSSHQFWLKLSNALKR